ncbi:MerR family DNA-binding protein, partial [Haloactinopolyspora sp.]|uniref:MerR family DNA-binding protein n=1 Tax=Haloactinopolyspora sp. TaxID=1966353 RepID=UPI0026371F87
DRVVFIARLRQTDMPIRDIQRYFDLVAQGPSTEPERLALMRAQRDAVRAQLDALQKALDVVEHKITLYGRGEGC